MNVNIKVILSEIPAIVGVYGSGIDMSNSTPIQKVSAIIMVLGLMFVGWIYRDVNIVEKKE